MTKLIIGAWVAIVSILAIVGYLGMDLNIARLSASGEELYEIQRQMIILLDIGFAAMFMVAIFLGVVLSMLERIGEK